MDLKEALALISSHVAGDESVGTAVTIDDIWNHLATRHQLAESTYVTYKALYRAQVKPHFGHRLAMSVDDALVIDYRAKRRGEFNKWGTEKRPIKPSSRNREVSLLMTILQWGAKNRLIPYCPIRFPAKEAENNIRETVVSEEQLEQVLNHHMTSQTLVAYALLLRDSGLRRAEGVGVQWQDFRVNDANPHAWRLYVTWRTAKGSFARYTILTRRTWDAIRRLPRHSNWVFHNEKTELPYEPDYMLAQWRLACDRVGAVGPEGNITLHDLRRTFATKLGEAGVAERKIIKLLGHHTRATIDRYLIGKNSDFDGISEISEKHTLQELTRLRVSKRMRSNTKLHT